MHRLLEEAHALVERATRDAAQVDEPADHSRAFDDNVRKMEALLVRMESQATQLGNLYVATLHEVDDVRRRSGNKRRSAEDREASA